MTTYLTFSDGAKFADIARNVFNGLGFGGGFNFWSPNFLYLTKNIPFPVSDTPPVMPFSIAFFFKMFGVVDLAVVATSFFYFLLSLIFVFLLGKKIFKSNLVGALSTLAVGFNYDLLDYATKGASESPFIFEIVASLYFISLRKKWATILSSLILVLMYFTRPQAFIYIAGLILFYLFDRFKTKKAVLFSGIIIILGILADRYLLAPLSGNGFFYSIASRGKSVIGQNLHGTAVSDSLRGLSVVVISSRFSGYLETFKKIFYNLYNFYKLLPQIISPYLFTLFTIGLFFKSKSNGEKSFKIASIFMVFVTLLVTAASIPFFRYIHPIIPLVYIIAVGTLVEILSSLISNKKLIVLCSFVLILLFGVGQTLGVLILDSRFERNTHNVGKPPVYAVLSYKLKEVTNPSDVVITNLDTWGSWYGERKTVWFPLEPKQLIDPATGTIPFDAIYLTSYLMDDPNYYVGDSWRQIFDNPDSPTKWTCDGCGEIAKEFSLKGIYSFPSSDNYDRQDAKAILLIKNE